MDLSTAYVGAQLARTRVLTWNNPDTNPLVALLFPDVVVQLDTPSGLTFEFTLDQITWYPITQIYNLDTNTSVSSVSTGGLWRLPGGVILRKSGGTVAKASVVCGS